MPREHFGEEGDDLDGQFCGFWLHIATLSKNHLLSR